MNQTTCPHCNAVNQHSSTHTHFTVATCGGCKRQYVRRPAGKVLAVLQTRIDGVSRRWEVTGILAGSPARI